MSSPIEFSDIVLTFSSSVVDKPNALLSLYRKEPNVSTKKEKKTRYMELFMEFVRSRESEIIDPKHIVFDLSITPTNSEFNDKHVRHAREDPPFDIDITAQRYDPAVKIKATADGKNLSMSTSKTLDVLFKVLLKTDSPTGENLDGDGFKDHITGFYKQVLDYCGKQKEPENTQQPSEEQACPAPQKYRIVYLKSNQSFYLVNAEDQLSLEVYLSTDISDYMTVFTEKRNPKKYVGLFEKLLPYDKAKFVINTNDVDVSIDVAGFFDDKDNNNTLPFVFHQDFYTKYIEQSSGVSKQRFYEIATLLFKQIYTRIGNERTLRSKIPNASVFYKLFSLSENTMKKRSKIYYDQEMDVKPMDVNQSMTLDLSAINDIDSMDKYIYSASWTFEEEVEDNLNTSRMTSRSCNVSTSDISFDLDSFTDDAQSVSENTVGTSRTILGDNYTIVKYFSKKPKTTVDLAMINKSVLSYLTICFLLQKWYAILYPTTAPAANIKPFKKDEINMDLTEIKHEFRIVLLSELKKQQILYDENMILCDIEHILEKGQYGPQKDDADIILLSNPKDLSSQVKSKERDTKQTTDGDGSDVLKALKVDINERIDNSFFDDHKGVSKFGRLLELNLNNDKKTGDKSKKTSTKKTGTKTTEPKDDIEKAIKNLTRVKKLIENMKNELFILAEPHEPKKDKRTSDVIHDNTAELTQNMKDYATRIKNNLVETYHIFADANGPDSPPIPDFTYNSQLSSMVEIINHEVKNNLDSYKALTKEAISQAAKDPALNNTIKTLIQKSKDNKHLIDKKTNNPDYTHHAGEIRTIYSAYCSIIPHLKSNKDNNYPLSSLIKYYFCVKDARGTNDAKKYIENLLDEISQPLVDYLMNECLDTYIQCIVFAKVYILKLVNTQHKESYAKQLNDCIPSILKLKFPENPPLLEQPDDYKTSYTRFLQTAIEVRSNDIFETIQPLLAAKAARK